MHKQVIPRKWRILCLKSLPKRCNSYELKQGLIDGSYPRHHLCFDDEMMSFHSSLNTLDNNKIKPESTIYRCLDNELEYQSIYAREALSIKIKTLVCSTADVQVFFFSFFVFFFFSIFLSEFERSGKILLIYRARFKLRPCELLCTPAPLETDFSRRSQLIDRKLWRVSCLVIRLIAQDCSYPRRNYSTYGL